MEKVLQWYHEQNPGEPPVEYVTMNNRKFYYWKKENQKYYVFGYVLEFDTENLAKEWCEKESTPKERKR